MTNRTKNFEHACQARTLVRLHLQKADATEGRGEGRRAYPKLVAFPVRIEFTLDERRQFVVEE